MELGWRDYTAHKGGETGARSAFEYDCKFLFKKMHPTRHVDTIKADPGDDGIDIYVGSIGQEPITVYQCKYFLDEFGDSQKGQIRDSFTTAITAETYSMEQWYLVVPYEEFNIDQSRWLESWKKRQCQQYNLRNDFIRVINGRDLIMLMKEHNIYETVFDIQHLRQIQKTHEIVNSIGSLLLGASKNDKPKEETHQYNVELTKTIFSISYDIEYEEYYVEREIDSFLKTFLRYHTSIWLFGESGCGKTTTITRTLISEGIPFHYCYLTSVVEASSVDLIFEEILIETVEKFKVLLPENVASSTNIIKKLVYALDKVDIGKNPIIYIDEISFLNDGVFLSFVNYIVAISRNYTEFSHGEKTIKFIVSTIQDPKKSCTNKAKAHENFKFVEVDLWTQLELSSLLNKIADNLKLEISMPDRNLILKYANGSPRKLKNVLLSKLTEEYRSFDNIINTFKVEEH